MKTSRRDFLKGIGAALVAAFVPRQDVEEKELPEASCQSVWADVEDVESITYNNSAIWKEWSESADGEVWYTVDGLTWEQGERFAPDAFVMNSSEIYYTHGPTTWGWDLEGDPEDVARIQRALDGCDCAPRQEFENVHLTFEAESVECMPDGSTVWHNARGVDSSGDCETENGWWSWYDPQEHADIDQGNIFTVSDCGQKRLIVCVPAESAPGLIETLEDRWL